MSANKDLNYAFSLSRHCLWFFGVWPDPGVPVSNFRRVNIRFIIVVCILFIYIIVPQVANMIHVWGNIQRIVQYIASVNFGMIALAKLIVTWYHSETLRTLMISVLTDWMTSKKGQERDTMLKSARSGRNLSFQCYLCCAIGIVFFTFFNSLRLYQNIKLSQQQRILVYHFDYFLYNAKKSPNYEITYLIQMNGAYYVVLINCSVDGFVSTLLLHMCGQLMNIRAALDDLISELADRSISSSKFRKRLGAIIIHHEQIIRNMKTINDCYSTALFIHMLVMTFQLCFETFQIFTIITDHLDVSILQIAFLFSYTLLVTSHLYIYCYAAEKLLTMSTGMAYSTYACKWYEVSANDARNLMFIIHRSMIPLRLTAGKFGFFSMEMFGMVRLSRGKMHCSLHAIFLRKYPLH